MVIETKGRKIKARIGFCAYPTCGAEFITESNVQKYCDAHRLESDRPLLKVQQAEAEDCNQYIASSEPKIVKCACALDGCGGEVVFKILPKLNVYPKYCENHRSEYRRWFHLKAREVKA